MFAPGIGCAALPLGLAVLLVPPPDIVMPGQRHVANELVFVASDALARWQLVAAPVRGLGGVLRIVPGLPVPFSGKDGTRLYALPADAELVADAAIDDLARWPSAPPPVAALWSVAAARPLAKVVTTCRFAGVRDGQVAIEVVSRAHFDAAGRPVDESLFPFVLLAVAGVGGVGLWRIARGRGPRAEA